MHSNFQNSITKFTVYDMPLLYISYSLFTELENQWFGFWHATYLCIKSKCLCFFLFGRGAWERELELANWIKNCMLVCNSIISISTKLKIDAKLPSIVLFSIHIQNGAMKITSNKWIYTFSKLKLFNMYFMRLCASACKVFQFVFLLQVPIQCYQFENCEYFNIIST